MKMCCGCYWRFEGEHEWRYGWPTDEGFGLVRMGWWNGDKVHGKVIDPADIEIRQGGG